MLIFNLAPRGKRAELEVAPLAYEVSLGPACDLVGPFGDAFLEMKNIVSHCAKTYGSISRQ